MRRSLKRFNKHLLFYTILGMSVPISVAHTSVYSTFLCQMGEEYIKGAGIFTRSRRAKSIEYLAYGENSPYSNIQLQKLTQIYGLVEDTPEEDILLHFLQYMERFQIEKTASDAGLSAIKTLQDPLSVIRKKISEDELLQIIDGILESFKKNQQIKELNSPKAQKVLQSFLEENQQFRKKWTSANSTMRSSLERERSIISACISKRSNPFKNRANRSFYKWSIGLGMGTSVASFLYTHRKEQISPEMLKYLGMDLALQFFLGSLFNKKASLIYSKNQPDLVKGIEAFFRLTLPRNGISSAIYAITYGISEENAHDELTLLKRDYPAEWEKIQAEASLALLQFSQNAEFKDQFVRQSMYAFETQKELDNFSKFIQSRGLINNGESFEELLVDPEREQEMIELLLIYSQEKSPNIYSKLFTNANERFLYDSAFEAVKILSMEKIFAYAGLNFLICNTGLNPWMAIPATGFFMSEKFVTDHLYYSLRSSYLGY